jgi:hypothetical protein
MRDPLKPRPLAPRRARHDAPERVGGLRNRDQRTRGLAGDPPHPSGLPAVGACDPDDAPTCRHRRRRRATRWLRLRALEALAGGLAALAASGPAAGPGCPTRTVRSASGEGDASVTASSAPRAPWRVHSGATARASRSPHRGGVQASARRGPRIRDGARSPPTCSAALARVRPCPCSSGPRYRPCEPPRGGPPCHVVIVGGRGRARTRDPVGEVTGQPREAACGADSRPGAVGCGAVGAGVNLRRGILQPWLRG